MVGARYRPNSVSVLISEARTSNGTVDIYDAILLAKAYGSTSTGSNWNGNADINGDNILDIYDALILANNYGKTA